MSFIAKLGQFKNKKRKQLYFIWSVPMNKTSQNAYEFIHVIFIKRQQNFYETRFIDFLM